MKQIIKNYLEGKATFEEQSQLLEWLRKKENRFVFDSYSLSWNETLDLSQLPEESMESWNQIQAAILEKSFKQWQRSRKIQLFFRYAAIFFFAISLAASLWSWHLSRSSQTGNDLFTKVEAENGQISKVVLSDGSTVWLNSGSKITYSNLFGKANRNIQLSGEAYFDVSHNEQLPFIVNCNELELKVLGTKFDVTSYEENKHINVVLEQGSVELLNTKVKSFNYRLKPGELATFDKKERELTVRNVNTTKFTSWKDGIINIYDQSLEHVVKRLEMRYNQKFIVNEEVKGLRYTFTIKNESLEDIIKLMEKITPIKATQKGNVIDFEMDISKINVSMNKQ